MAMNTVCKTPLPAWHSLLFTHITHILSESRHRMVSIGPVLNAEACDWNVSYFPFSIQRCMTYTLNSLSKKV